MNTKRDMGKLRGGYMLLKRIVGSNSIRTAQIPNTRVEIRHPHPSVGRRFNTLIPSALSTVPSV